MNRYLVKFKAGEKYYELVDDKTNITLALFSSLEYAREYCDYMNKKNEMISLLLKQISDEVDEEFK